MNSTPPVRGAMPFRAVTDSRFGEQGSCSSEEPTEFSRIGQSEPTASRSRLCSTSTSGIANSILPVHDNRGIRFRAAAESRFGELGGGYSLEGLARLGRIGSTQSDTWAITGQPETAPWFDKARERRRLRNVRGVRVPLRSPRAVPQEVRA